MECYGGGRSPTGDGEGDNAMQMKHVALGAALLLVALGATACGKRGPLEPPPGPDKTATAEGVTGEGGEVLDERSEPRDEQHDSFILDVLL